MLKRALIDPTIIVLAQSGDIAAFEQLLRQMHGPLRQYVTNLAGQAAVEDILQEVALKVFRQIKHLREPDVFMPWVFRIATRVAFVHLKKAKQWRDLENDPELIRSLSAGAGFSAIENFDSDFLNLIDHASPASRAVLLLHYQQHLSIEEAAAILEIPIGTAKSRLSYGVASIRKHLKEKQEK